MIGTVNTLQQEAVKNIKKLIINGDLKLGTRINEVEVSNLLNMSRGPIRESLRILNQEGLVTYVPRKGMFVTALEAKDIHEIYDIRFYLEKSAVELGFHLVTNEKVEKLEEIVKQMEIASQTKEKDALVQLDYEFHKQIITFPNYLRLKNNWEVYTALIELIFAEVFRLGSEKVDEIPENHRVVVDALKTGEKLLFINELHIHYQSGKEKLISVLKQRKQKGT